MKGTTIYHLTSAPFTIQTLWFQNLKINQKAKVVKGYKYPVLGISDVSWNNPSAPTPHLDSLAASPSGIILDNAYTLPVCTPSRAALMSGTYPFKLGLQVSQ